MSVILLADFKAWAKIATSADDTVGQACIDAAELYFLQRTGRDWAVKAMTAVERVGILTLAASYYENREAATPAQLNEVPHGVERIIVASTQIPTA